jgi:hypothetical protein
VYQQQAPVQQPQFYQMTPQPAQPGYQQPPAQPSYGQPAPARPSGGTGMFDEFGDLASLNLRGDRQKAYGAAGLNQRRG